MKILNISQIMLVNPIIVIFMKWDFTKLDFTKLVFFKMGFKEIGNTKWEIRNRNLQNRKTQYGVLGNGTHCN